MTLADLIVNLRLNAQEFGRGIDSALTKWELAAGNMVRGGAIISAGVTAPIVGVGMAAYNMATQLQTAEIGFTTMLGSADKAGVHLEKLKEFAAATPFEFVDLVKASQRMQALGFEAEQVIPNLTAIGNAAAGLGGGADLINRLTLALGQMMAKGKVSGEEMRQLAEAGIPAWQMLAEAANMSVAEAQEAARKGVFEVDKVLPVLIEGMNKKFGGLMENFANTVMGRLSNLKDNISYVMGDIGKSVMPILNQLLETVVIPLAAKLKDLAQQFAALDPKVRNVIVAVAAMLAAVGPLLLALGGLGLALTALGPLLGSAGILGALWSLAAIITPVALAIAGLASNAELAAKFLDPLKSIGQSLFVIFKELATAAVAVLKPLAEIGVLLIGGGLLIALQGLAEVLRIVASIVTGLDGEVLALAAAFTAAAAATYAFTSGLAVSALTQFAINCGNASKMVTEFGKNAAFYMTSAEAASWKLLNVLSLLGPVVAALVGYGLGTWLRQFTNEARDHEAVAQRLNEVLREQGVIVERGSKSLEEWVAAMNEAASATRVFDSSLEGMKAKVELAQQAYDAMAAQFVRGEASAKDLRKAQNDLTAAQDKFSASLKTAGVNMDAANRRVEEAQRRYDIMQAALDRARKSLDDTAVSQAVLTGAQDRAATATDDLKTAEANLQYVANLLNVDLKTQKGAVDEVATSASNAIEPFQTVTDILSQWKTEAAAVARESAAISYMLDSVIGANERLRALQAQGRVGVFTDIVPPDLPQRVEATAASIDSLVGSVEDMTDASLEALLRFPQTPKVVQDATEAITEQAKGNLGDLSVAWGEHFDQVAARAQRWANQVSTIVNDFGKNIANNIVDIFFGGKGEKQQLAAQRAELEQSLVDREQEWADYQVEVAATMEEITARHAQEMAFEELQVMNSLQGREHEYEQYREALLQQIEDTRQAHMEEMAAEIQDVEDALEEKRQKYEDSRADILATIAEVTEDNRRNLDRRLQDLQDNLRDQQQSYDDFVTDTQQRLSDLYADYADDEEDKARDTDRRIADEDKKLEREKEDTEKRIAELLKSGKRADSTEIRDLQEKLRRKEEDHGTTIQRLQEDLQDWVDDHRRKLEQQERDLRESLDRKTRDHEEYLAENQADMEAATADANRELERRVGDLQDKLADMDQEWADYQAAAQAKIQEITRTHVLEMEQQVRDLRGKIDTLDMEWGNYQNKATLEIAKIRVKHNAEMDAQLTDLRGKLADQAAEWATFQEDVNAELEKIGKDEAGLTIWSKLKAGFHDMLFGPDGMLASLLRFSTEELLKTFLDPMKRALGTLLSSIPGLGGLFGGIFGGGGAATPTPSPTPGGGTGVPGLPTGGGATVLGTMIAPGVGTAIGAAIDLGIALFEAFKGVFGPDPVKETRDYVRALYTFTYTFMASIAVQQLGQLVLAREALGGIRAVLEEAWGINPAIHQIAANTGVLFDIKYILNEQLHVGQDTLALLGGPPTDRVTERQPLLVQLMMDGNVVGNALIADVNDSGVTL